MERAYKKKYHYIYKTVCKVTGKFYIGMHSTDDLEDGYKGSGKRLWYSIRKHRIENHSTEILEFLQSREELRNREAEIVNESLLKDKACLNLTLGGSGDWYHVNATGKHNNKNNHRKTGNIGWKEQAYKSQAPFKEAVSKGLKKYYSENKNWWFGKKHSEEAKKKISEIHLANGHQKGERNSQFGTRWISNLETLQSKRIKNDFLYEYPWVEGRNSWKDIEKKKDRQEEIAKKKQERNQISLANLEETVTLYKKFNSLRLVAEQLGVSYVAIHNRIKKYEVLTGQTVK